MTAWLACKLAVTGQLTPQGGVYLKLRHPVTALGMPLRPPGVERLLLALAKASSRGQAGQLALPFSGQDRENTPCSAVVPRTRRGRTLLF
jgi:hypothetical protein